MRSMTVVFGIASLLSRMYLGIIFGLLFWAMAPIIIGWTPTLVMSDSMEPNIQVGDILVAQPLNDEQKENLSKGHVLLADDPSHADTLITHRVVNIIEGTGFITKGDANSKADPTMVPMSNVHGLERLRIPMIGLPVQALRAGNSIPLVAFLALTILAQLIVLIDNKKNNTSASNQGGIPARKKGRHVAPKKIGISYPFKKIILHFTAPVLIVIVWSVVIAGSAAYFSGTTSGSNDFSASGNFSQVYKDNILKDNPFAYYRLDETDGLAVTDTSPNGHHASYNPSGVTFKVAGALTRDAANKAVTLDGEVANVFTTTPTVGPSDVTLQIWFKTTAITGGKLIGFSSELGVDRVLYMTTAGKIVFGTDATTKTIIQSSNSYNDGEWHMVTATRSGNDSKLHVDGQVVATGTTTSTPSTSDGLWEVGGGDFSGWPTQPTNSYFNGSIDEVAIFTKSLTSAQIATNYSLASG